MLEVLFLSSIDDGPLRKRAKTNDNMITVINSCFSLVAKASLGQASATEGVDNCRNVAIAKERIAKKRAKTVEKQKC